MLLLLMMIVTTTTTTIMMINKIENKDIHNRKNICTMNDHGLLLMKCDFALTVSQH